MALLANGRVGEMSDDFGPLVLLTLLVLFIVVTWLTWGYVGLPNRDP